MLWCRSCRADFVALVQRRSNPSATPSSETIFCPACRAPRKMMLPPDVEGPVTGVFTLAAWESRPRKTEG